MENFNKESFKDITLLYVEDDAMTLEEISYFLEKYVKKLIVAKNGEEGLELFKLHNPDMVITDIQMPVMNGLDMAKKILQINPSVPIAVTSAYSDSEYLINAIEIGIDKYILKPVNMMEVLAVVYKSLHLSFSTKNYEEYIQFILDSNPTFMFIMNSNKVEYANKNLLNLLGYENVELFNEQIKECKELFEFDDLVIEDNYLEYIMKNSHKKFLVNLKNKNCEVYYDRKFYVSYKYFETMKKSVFIFTEESSSNLLEINEIVKDLVDDIKMPENRINVVDKINKILELTSKSL